MRTPQKSKRTLRAESLESRQLLHGGAMTGGGEAPTTEERATEIVSRFDANEDMELSQDEVSERMWNRLTEADGDENETVSVEELTAHLDAAAAERGENESGEDERGDRDRNRGRRGVRAARVSIEERIDMFFAENDTNTDGVITDADDVSEELLARIVDADVDGNGVSADDLLARHETRQLERAQERFDARFAALDDNGDGGITADEVSEQRWERISAADGEDGDGVVTADELQTYVDAQRVEREAERDAAEEGEEAVEGEGEVVTADEAAPQEAQRQRRGRAQSGRAGRRG